MNIGSSIPFLIFFGSLFLFNDVSCMIGKLKKPFSKSKEKEILETSQTTQPNKALEIYNAIGVSDKDNLCKSFDRKTSRINGYPFCKGAILKIYERRLNPNLNLQVLCQYTPVDKNIYKYATIIDSAVYGRKIAMHKMVLCMYGNNKPAFYLLHATGNYYYIFEHRPDEINVHLIAYLWLSEINITFPSIGERITNDPQEANNIFASYGYLKYKPNEDNSHVCQPIAETSSLIMGDYLCSQVENLYELPAYVSRPSSCETKTFSRVIVDKSVGIPKTTGNIYVAKCMYRNGLTGKWESFYVFNTTRDLYYFVARYVDGKRKIVSIIKRIEKKI